MPEVPHLAKSSTKLPQLVVCGLLLDVPDEGCVLWRPAARRSRWRGAACVLRARRICRRRRCSSDADCRRSSRNRCSSCGAACGRTR